MTGLFIDEHFSSAVKRLSSVLVLGLIEAGSHEGNLSCGLLCLVHSLGKLCSEYWLKPA